MKLFTRVLAGALLLASPTGAFAQATQAPVTLPALLADIGGPAASGCPYILVGAGQSVEAGADHNGPHNNPANTYIANVAGSGTATAFVAATYGAAPLNIGTDGVGGQNVTTSTASNTYVNPAVSYAWYLRQSGLIPASRPIVIIPDWLGAQSISDWVDGTPTDMWTPLTARLALFNASTLSPSGVACPINHVQWNQGQNDTSGTYGSASAYLGAFDRLIVKFQALSNWSKFTRMDIAQMGTWAGATGMDRIDALDTMDSGCRYSFATETSTQGLTQSTDQPGPHPDGNSVDEIGRRSFVNDQAGRIGGAYRCAPRNAQPQTITTSGAYVASVDETRNGVLYQVNGASIQLPNAALLKGTEPIYLFSSAGATLTSAGTLRGENLPGTTSSFTLAAGVRYTAEQLDGTSFYLRRDSGPMIGNQACNFSTGFLSGAQALSNRNFSGACYGLSTATVTLTAAFGEQGMFFGAVGTSTIALASGNFTFPDGTTGTTITLTVGQAVQIVGVPGAANALIMLVSYIGQPAPGLQASTVAALPACSATTRPFPRMVSDAAASPVYNATVTGGGSLYLPVFCNGTNWTNH